LKDDYDRIGTELKILEQKNLALEQIYQQDKQDSNKMRDQFENVQLQYEHLQHIVKEKDMELQKAQQSIVQADEKLQKANSNDEEIIDEINEISYSKGSKNINDNSLKLNTVLEKKNYMKNL